MSLEVTLAGKKVLVTGGANGIGRALCKRLHAQGAKVVALDVNQELLTTLVKECPGVHNVCVNLLDWDAARKAVEEVARGVNALVNNAGINISENFLSATPANYDKVMGINLKAYINVSQVIVKAMIEAKSGGSIVNIASVASKTAALPCPSYNLSKAGVEMLTKSMAVELGQHKIRVNAVSPIFVLTDICRDAVNGGFLDGFMHRIPMGRIAEMDEVINSILFLLSDVAPMVNGHNLVIDGGFTAA
jgi:NAD(P)-dependent dehydrogenase (short-subunit alcohol dehydrogenase family)